MAILDAESFLPTGLINTLKSNGAWNKDDEEWGELILKLENSSIAIIRAMVNYKAIENDTDLLEELLSKHIQSQLLIPLIHMQGMQEAGELVLTQFNELVTVIRENQKDNGITTDERDVSVPGILVFN